MSMDSGTEALPRKNRRVPKRNVEGDISPGLRRHITQAAEKIRSAHEAELADVLRAARAGRLFSKIIGPNGTPDGAGEGVGSLPGELGGLLGDAIRAGTGLLQESLTVLTQAWMTTVIGPSANPNREPSRPRRAAARPMPNTAVEPAVPNDRAPETTASSAEELMLRGVLRQFMPMLVTAVNQGGDGYGLARTVIALYGRPIYDQASGLGKDKIMRLVRQEPDLWTQVAPIEAEFSKFLDEFTGYDAWIATAPDPGAS